LPHIALEAMVIDFGLKIELWLCKITFQKQEFKKHNMDTLLSSLKGQAA
jgi:hypothetical protein